MANDIPNLGLLSPPLARSSSAESALPAPIADLPASEADIDAFKSSVLAKLTLAIGKDGAAATPRDWFVATALALRDRVIHRWLAVNRASHALGRKRVYYLSLEFLIGRLFADVVENLRMTEIVKAAADSGRPLREVAVEHGVEEEILDKALDLRTIAAGVRPD